MENHNIQNYDNTPAHTSDNFIIENLIIKDMEDHPIEPSVATIISGKSKRSRSEDIYSILNNYGYFNFHNISSLYKEK